MTAGPAMLIPAPPLSPPWGNLLAVAQVVDHDDEGFMNGVGYSPENCADVELWGLCRSVSEVQRITMAGGPPTGGTFTLSFRGSTTAPIAFNATAAEVVAALSALPTIGPGGVTGAGGPFPGTPVDITFVGVLVQGDVPMMTADATGLTETLGSPETTMAVAETTTGATGATMATGLNRPGALDAQPFTVVARDSCSTFGWQAAEYEARARRALQAKEGGGIERELWTGTLQPNNPRLADGQAAYATAVGLRRGLAELSQAASEGNAGRGMIHARPYLVTLWYAAGLLRVEQNRLIAPTGHYVVAGPGYPGTGPAGQAIAAGVEWAYATDPIVVHRGPVHIDPEPSDGMTDGERIAIATDRLNNRVEFRALRGAVSLFNNCVNAAVSIDTTVE